MSRKPPELQEKSQHGFPPSSKAPSPSAQGPPCLAELTSIRQFRWRAGKDSQGAEMPFGPSELWLHPWGRRARSHCSVTKPLGIGPIPRETTDLLPAREQLHREDLHLSVLNQLLLAHLHRLLPGTVSGEHRAARVGMDVPNSPQGVWTAQPLCPPHQAQGPHLGLRRAMTPWLSLLLPCSGSMATQGTTCALLATGGWRR